MDVIGTTGSPFIVGSKKSAQKIMFSWVFSTVFYVAHLLMKSRFQFCLILGAKTLFLYVFLCPWLKW